MDQIERRAAIDAINHVEVNFTVKSSVDFSAHKKEVQEIIDHILDAQEKALDELPSAEKTGKWIYDKYHLAHVCSECGGEALEALEIGLGYRDFSVVLSEYCPHCGSRMLEIEEEEDEEEEEE